MTRRGNRACGAGRGLVPAGWLAVGALTLAACGGGSDKPQAPPVVLALDAGQSIVATVMETGTMPSQAVTGKATGDLATLSGATIFAVIEDPASLFASSWVTASENGTFVVALTGKALATPGRYTGTLKLHASLDPEGRTPLAGSPLSVPYDVTVLDAIALSSTAVSVEVPFGTGAVTRTVKATLTSFATGWGLQSGYQRPCTFSPGQPADPGSGALTCARDGTITFTFYPRAPGTFTQTLDVWATVQHSGRSFSFSHPLTVTYVVTPADALDYAAWPPELVVTRSLGDAAFEQDWYTLVANSDATLERQETQYLDHPLAADGHPMVAAWWSEAPYKGTSTCSGSGASANCLPEGTYTARVHYVLTRNGARTDLYYPITMVISAASYFPVDVGSYRDYRRGDSAYVTSRNQTVAADATTATQRTTDSTVPTYYFVSEYALAGGGAYLAASQTCFQSGAGCGRYTYTPPSVILPPSVTAGYTETTVSAYSGTAYPSVTRALTVDGVESVTVPAGTFSALKLTTRITSTVQDDYFVTWWVRGIGQVKSESYHVGSSASPSSTWLLTGWGTAPLP